MLSRRHFLYGAAGVAALAAVGGGAAWAAGRSSDDDALKTLKVPESAVTAQTALEEMENYEDAVTLAGSAKLPFGTLVWCSDDAVAACLLPTETAKPLAEVGLLDLVSAECTTILEHAVGEAEGFEIYDVRANAAGVIWTEADILDSLWRVYAAPLSGTTLGEPQLLDEGDVNWEMPTLAAADGYAFWQRLPQLDGNARVETTVGGGANRGVVQGSSVTVTNSGNAKPAAPGKGGKGGDYVNSDLSGRNFAGAQLAGRKFTNVDLSRANLSGADLRGAELVNVSLEQADLRGANLTGAKMVNVDLDAALLEGATWTDGRRCRAAC